MPFKVHSAASIVRWRSHSSCGNRVCSSGCKNGEEDEGVIKALMKSSKAVALSGLSDPVYVEAVLTVHHLTLLIELLLINQTSTILEGITISLGTHGELAHTKRS